MDKKDIPENGSVGALKNEKNTVSVKIEDEMRGAYLDYAMSVIVRRALPDVRDGLKPVHRRILYAMYDLGNVHQKPYKKSARVVGDVIGKYHPHGDVAVYDTLVRMAQNFSMRYPLIDGQGNFGSIDGDAPAAMRYTEIRMEKITEELLTDIDRGTVDYRPNYDDSLMEPKVFPSRIPHLLVNGSTGIAVGMATSIPPHNLTEVIDATLALIDFPHLQTNDLFQYIKGPDFPTGASLFGGESVRSAYRSGRGFVVLRAKTEIEKWKEDRERIIVSEIPYQVNKARLIEKIAELVKEKKIEGISDLRDESDRKGMRIVIELKKKENSTVLLNRLYKLTQLQENYSIHLLAIDGGKPKVFNLRDMIWSFVDHRKEIVTRRTLFNLKKAEARAHLLEGLKKAVEHIDAVIALIKEAKSPEDAKLGLKKDFLFSDIQSQAILEMRLQRLTGLERNKILEEYQQVLVLIQELKKLLENETLIYGVIKEELLEVKKNYGDARRTEILFDGTTEFEAEDLIKQAEALVSITHAGYIKRTDPNFFRSQHRGGRGVTAVTTTEEDLVTSIFQCNTLHCLLCFTDRGRVYWLKVYKIPEVTRYAKGKAIVNLLSLLPGEKVRAILPVGEFKKNEYILMVTEKGITKKTPLSEFKNIRPGGLVAVSIDPEDQLVAAKRTQGNNDVFLCSKEGMSIRFNEQEVRPTGRGARGVFGMSLSGDDSVVALEILDPTQEGGEAFEVLTISENGFGKRTPVTEYRKQGRAGVGVINMKMSERNGFIVGSRQVLPKDDVMLISNKGKMIRIHVGEISGQGRNAQGVRLISMSPGEKIVSFEYLVENTAVLGEKEVEA